ncbi:MAG: sulfur oxidation c-type cytochrome SoxA [Betaproteobacteria bacterium]
MRALRVLLAWGLLLGLSLAAAQQRQIPLDQLRSGLSYAGGDVRALQADEFANPAQLWLQRGEQRWSEPVGRAGKSCMDCHGAVKDGMRGVAARYPALDSRSGQLLNLEDRISQCRLRHQQGPDLAFESDELLSLSLYVSQASVGQALRVAVDGPARSHLLEGERLFMQRRGQLNLACTHCHDQNFGRRFYTDPLSQGQSNGYPVYRLEWQKVGSLERRLRSCFVGVRAEPLPWGAQEVRQLALYLGWRGQGLPVEVPAVRK